MEQPQVISCANCASTAPVGKPYQRCAGCKQASYCSKDCQKEHWKQHKRTCKQQQSAPAASAYTTATGDHDDGDDDDWYAQRELTPLAFLQDEPFPGLNLSIHGSPVAIVDTNKFDEETDKEELTTARAVATVLWNWHPNALRAFLDTEKYSSFEFAITDKYPGREKVINHMITRKTRAVLVGYYDQDFVWGHEVSYGMPEDGRWKPLWGSDGYRGNDKPDYVDSMGRLWAKDCMYYRRWEPQENRTYELTPGRGKVDPASLY